MNIRDLKYIIAVADLKHFGKAAQNCFVSQPTLSGQIKKLEDQLGVKIFERNNKRIIATEIGIKIIDSARKIINEVNNINEIAKTAEDPFAGKFYLGAFPTLATYIFPKLVERIKQTMPNLRLILLEEKTSELIEKLEKGKIDAALLALPIQAEFLESKALFDDKFYLAVPSNHELASKQAVSQEQLSKHKLLLLEEGHCLRDQALEVCQLHNISEEQDFKATSLETLRQMVKSGTGITFIPEIAINNDEKGLNYLPFKAPIPERKIGLVWRKTSIKKEVILKIIQLF